MKNGKFTCEQIIEALQKTNGMVYLAAEALGCHNQTIYNYINKHPSVKEAFESETGKVLDVGEQKLFEHVKSGEAWAVCFLLKTKGRHRGYVEKLETGWDKETRDFIAETLEQKLNVGHDRRNEARNGHASTVASTH